MWLVRKYVCGKSFHSPYLWLYKIPVFCLFDQTVKSSHPWYTPKRFFINQHSSTFPFIMLWRLAFYFLNAYVNKINFCSEDNFVSCEQRGTPLGTSVRDGKFKIIMREFFCCIKQLGPTQPFVRRWKVFERTWHDFLEVIFLDACNLTVEEVIVSFCWIYDCLLSIKMSLLAFISTIEWKDLWNVCLP